VGIAFTCQIDPSASCNSLTCIKSINATGGTNIPSDFNARLTRPLSADPAGIPRCASDAFADIFAYADGRSGPVKGPPGLNTTGANLVNGSADAPGTVYVAKACQSPRAALIVLSHDNGGGTTNPVIGFAGIYIVGCFNQNTDPLTYQTNSCGTGFNSPSGQIEVRGVMVNVFLSDQSVGGIGTITTNSPLTIQTTK
jgi:hypothetical protein